MKKRKIDHHTQNRIDYFKKSYAVGIIGGLILAIGCVLLWLGGAFGFLGYILGALLIPVGFVMFIVGSAKRIPDDYFETLITNQMAGLDIEIDTDKSYHLKLLDEKKEILLEGYRMHEGVMFKRLNNGELRTSEYSRTKIRLLRDRLYILNREVSLIYDEKTVTNIYEPTYDKIISVEVKREEKDITFNGNKFFVRPCLLFITTTDGVISLPCVNAVTTDKLPRMIQKQMEAYFEEKATKSAK